jgi:UDP-N-acetylmuramate dehydrogenase
MEAARLRALLAAALPTGAVREREALAPYTTFGVGGPAEFLVDVRSEASLGAALDAARLADAPVTVLGGGSNVVVADAGISGLVLRVSMVEIAQPTPGVVRAGAGATVNGLVRWSVGRGLAGLEAWAGTPGTVGGAVYGNAHYGGRNIGDLVVRARLMSLGGIATDATREAMAFAYDTSRLQRTREILVWAEFGVASGQPAALRAVARAALAHRKRTQPLALPSAGCLFQNPDPLRDRLPEGLPASAGALIDRAGLKGLRVGGATVSDVHGNFVVTDGSATATDILELARRVRETVRDRFGVELRYEVVFLGQDEHGASGH